MKLRKDTLNKVKKGNGHIHLSEDGENVIVNSHLLKEQAEKYLQSESIAIRVTSTALALVIIAGVLTAFAVAPGLTRIAAEYRRSKKYTDKQLWSAAQNLKKQKYIEEKTDSFGKPRVLLTEKGKRYFEKMIFEESCISDPKKWDGEWRFVLFDIPVCHSRARDALRFRLSTLGFYQYQKSVWVYPHPCEKEVLFVADYFGVGDFVEVLEVKHLTKDANLRKHFHL
jgi:hypothetical protein